MNLFRRHSGFIQQQKNNSFSFNLQKREENRNDQRTTWYNLRVDTVFSVTVQMFVYHVCFIAREVIYIRHELTFTWNIFLSRLRTALEILEKLLRTLYKSRNVEPPQKRLKKNSRPFTVFTVRHTAHRTLILLVSMYMLLGYCQVRSCNIIQFIILCNVTAILIFFVVKLEEEARQCWLVKLIHCLIIVTLLILEHATGTKSSWVRAVWRLTSVTAETELTNGDSRNKNNYKKKKKIHLSSPE